MVASTTGGELEGKRVLLIISGGISAYKCLDLIRRLRERACRVRCILTEAASHLVAPLAVATLSEERVYRDLFSLTESSEIGHIRLSRDADLVVLAPATANILAKMTAGIADDLATTALLATDKPILAAPAMNVVMWAHPATRRNVAELARRGVHFVGPGSGDLACGEVGAGRMAEPDEILESVAALLVGNRPLAGVRALVTSGPTHEPIDPVRFLGNRSSGKQGHAIAGALARAGARTVLVSGPTALPDPPGVEVHPVETARQMLAACRQALPVDVAVFAAAVADWRPEAVAHGKLKKGGPPPPLELVENPDILATVAAPGPGRPRLVVGFAAETGDLEKHARAKLQAKGCDWIVANDVSASSGTFGGDHNTVTLVSTETVDSWPTLTKQEVAARLVEHIARRLGASSGSEET